MSHKATRYIPGHVYLRSEKSVPDTAGVYAIAIRSGGQILRELGYATGSLPLWTPSDGYDHLYTGSSCDLRSRIKCHALGSFYESGLRHTLLAAEQVFGALSKVGLPLPEASNVEYALDFWMARHCLYVLFPCEDYVDRERTMLKTWASPVNVEHRARNGFARVIMRLRGQYQPAFGCPCR